MTKGGRNDDSPRPPPPAPPPGDLGLDFSGPPLALPGEEEDGRSPPIEAESPASAPEANGPGRRARPSSVPPEVTHDEWSRDRLRRGSDVHRLPPLEDILREADALPYPPDDEVEEGEGEVPRRRDSIVPGSAEPTDALRLVDKRRPSSMGIDLAGEMADRFALGDFTAALRTAELLLGQDPRNVEARQTAKQARERLIQLYTSRLGSLGRIPFVNVPDTEVRWLGLDHRAGFLLSRVNGALTIEEVVDVSGMQRMEALKLLAELYDANAIRFDD